MPPCRFVVSYAGLLAVYASPTGLIDWRTQQPEQGGGQDVGDYVDLTDAEAASLCANQPTPIFGGRYRFVYLDPGATAANVLQGTAVGFAPGLQVKYVSILTAGTGQTPGVYTATASSGGAVIQYTIGAAGTLTAPPLVLNPGVVASGTTPTFTIAAGGTPATVAAEMSVNPNQVTDYSAAVGGIVRGLFLAPVTAAQIAAGAYVFIQEAGIGQVLGGTVGTGPAVGNSINAAAGGVFTGAAANVVSKATVGYAIDLPQSTALYRVQMELPFFGN